MPELLVKYLRDANPVPYRSDLGPLDDLVADIQEKGIREPLLITHDFGMIDGFRRLAAAERLHMETVPIQVISSWADLTRNFRPAEEDCYPYNWEDLMVLWTGALKPLHQQHRFKAAISTRRTGIKPDHPRHYSEYVIDIAAMYGLHPTSVKTIRDYIHRLSTLEAQYPVFVKGVRALLPSGEAARNIAASRVIKAVMDKLTHTDKWTQEEALTVLEQRLEAATTSDRPRVPRVTNIKLDRDAPVTSKKLLDNTVTILDQVAMQTRGFVNFNMTNEEVDEILDGLVYAVTEFNSLRKRLQASIEPPAPPAPPAPKKKAVTRTPTRKVSK